MNASGEFEVNLEPQAEDSHPVGRMLINKTYTGELLGTGIGQMISKSSEAGYAVYSALEEFKGSIGKKTGSFTLFHIGKMSATEQSLEISIVPGSGTEQLAGIAGQLSITQEQGGHQYLLEYTL